MRDLDSKWKVSKRCPSMFGEIFPASDWPIEACSFLTTHRKAKQSRAKQSKVEQAQTMQDRNVSSISRSAHDLEVDIAEGCHGFMTGLGYRLYLLQRGPREGMYRI